MRTILFFDLPSITTKEKRNYLLFRRFLINEGFIMLQESVYSKLILNSEQEISLVERIKKNAPKEGIIQVLTITEKQYCRIKYVTGKAQTKIIDSEERLVVI